MTAQNLDASRCAWANRDRLLAHYHDTQWGVPEKDSRALWEKLILDGFQAGLSWLIILRKRQHFVRVFAQFEPSKVACFSEEDVARLLEDPGIVRSRAKIVAAIDNAKAYLAMQDKGEDFSHFCWQAVGGKPILLKGNTVPTQTDLSVALAKALKQRGFRFVGPTIVYAWMQATGLVNDHHPDCFLHHTLQG